MSYVTLKRTLSRSDMRNRYSIDSNIFDIYAFPAFRPFLPCSFRGIEESFSPRVSSFTSMAAATRGRHFEFSTSNLTKSG